LLNSGYFYRAVTYLAIQDDVDFAHTDALLKLAKQSVFNVNAGTFWLNGKDITAYLHNDEISNNVAALSSFAPLRAVLNDKMRHIAGKLNVVCEGRDIGTVVFPQAELKIYLDASVKVRAKRRFEQGFSIMSLDEIEKNIHYRDEVDKNKPVGALKIAQDAHYIDSSLLSLNEVYNQVVVLIKEKEEELSNG
jgi:cytidylate kinase/small subunit ribosomal protein S1